MTAETAIAPRSLRQVALRLLIGLAVLALAVFASNPDDYARFLAEIFSGRGVLDDTFQYIPPYIERNGTSLFAGDAHSAYVRFGHAPQGYDMLYAFLGNHFDIRTAAHVVGFALVAVLLIFMALTGHAIAGLPGALCAAFIVLNSEFFLHVVFHGLPRSFARPILAITLYGLVSGRLGFVAVATVMGSLFYYQAAILSGLALLAYCAIPYLWRRGAQAPGLLRRASLLAVTGVVSLGLLGSSVSREHGFGPLITPGHIAEFPEAGRGGRDGLVSFQPVRHLVRETVRTFTYETLRKNAFVTREAAARDGTSSRLERMVGPQSPARMVIAGAIALLAGSALVAGLVVFPRRRIAVVLSFAAVSLATYLAAWVAYPLLFVPDRYFIGVQLVTALVFTWLAAHLVRRLAPSLTVFGQSAVLIGVVSLILIATGRPQWDSNVVPSQAEMALYDVARTLPTDAVIAGWPTLGHRVTDNGRLIDALPYHGERSVLVSYEIHQIFREGYVLMMRERMNVIIDAIVVGEPAAFDRLHDAFGVTHLVIDEKLLETQRLVYFEPFQSRLDALDSHTAGLDYMRSGAAGPIVYDNGGTFIVALTPNEGDRVPDERTSAVISQP